MKVLLALLLAGCATSNPQVPTVYIEYQRSGGIRGQDDHLVIHEDGTAQLRQKAVRSEITLTEDVMGELRNLLADMEFRELRREYLPQRPGADLYEYVISFGGHTVRTRDTAVPDSLHPLLALLNRIIDGA